MRYAKLKGLMRERGVTQAELAKRLGISSSSMYNKLSGRSPFMIDEAFKIVIGFGIPEREIDTYFFEK